jgi:hypothetical protein
VHLSRNKIEKWMRVPFSLLCSCFWRGLLFAESCPLITLTSGLECAKGRELLLEAYSSSSWLCCRWTQRCEQLVDELMGFWV